MADNELDKKINSMLSIPRVASFVFVFVVFGTVISFFGGAIKNAEIIRNFLGSEKEKYPGYIASITIGRRMADIAMFSILLEKYGADEEIQKTINGHAADVNFLS